MIIETYQRERIWHENCFLYYVLIQTTRGKYQQRYILTRGRAGGSPLTPLQYDLIFCSFEPLNLV
jgi:hypothetical protein